MVAQDVFRTFTGLMSVLTVLTLLFVGTAAPGNNKNNNSQTSTDQDNIPKMARKATSGQSVIPKKPFTNLLTLKVEDYKEAFKSLDVNNDNKINSDDLKSFYYHKDSIFAIQKFIQLIDTSDTPGSINLQEFTSYMNKNDQLQTHVHDITFLRTVEARKKFYADEILTYVFLVVDENAINSLFDSIDTNKDGKIDFNEIKDMQSKIKNEKKLVDGEAKLVLAEIGAGSDTISREDFKNYLLGGKISFLFRECRKKLTGKSAEYDNTCLIRKLIRYTTRHLTEYMMTLVFNELDAKDRNQLVSFNDVQEVYGCNENNAKQFTRYITGGKEREVTYGEIRLTFVIPPIKHFLEHGCLGGGSEFVHLEERAFCLKWKLWTLISKNFFPRFVGVPDLDLIFLFEDLDTSDDGVIERREDLEKGKRWATGLAMKFMDEVGPPEANTRVNLDDFFFHFYEPYMMCALAECQIITENDKKLECYNNEMFDMITNGLVRSEVNDFFGFYKHSIIYHVTLEQFNLPGPVIDNFLTELGQGDQYVNPTEFSFYVQQQDLGRLFVTAENVTPKKHFAPSVLHEKLLFYLENYMTEFDIVILFARLDTNNDMVIDKKDIDKVKEIDAALVARMAIFGNKKLVTFHEFWLFLNSKPPGSQEPRKRQLEKDCGKIYQEQQINCFKDKLKSIR